MNKKSFLLITFFGLGSSLCSMQPQYDVGDSIVYKNMHFKIWYREKFGPTTMRSGKTSANEANSISM